MKEDNTMANYNQVSYGSQGSDVTELQKRLNKAGNYNLAEDGIFGDKTLAAVKDYQTNNNLDVDGIVGKNTWGSITGSKPSQNAAVMGTSTGTAQTTSATKNAGGYQYADYQESDTVKQAEAMLNEQLAQKPGEYQSTWQAQLNDTINKILNREKFSYDLNGDALYQQYKDKYIQQGKMAMMDTMGQAQAMTGGYGNSYAQSVGQQAYQQSLQQLNDIVPELYQMAYDQYNQEGQDMYNQAALMAQQEDRDYGRYQDALSAWQAERDYLTGRYDSERDYDYGKYIDERDFGYGAYIDDRNYRYQKDRDAIADRQWDETFRYQQEQDSLAEGWRQKEYDLALDQWNWEKDQAAAGSGGGGGNGGNGNNPDGGDAPASTLWYATGTYDDNGNPVFRNSEGKTQAFGAGVNPYTGTKHKDAKYGTFSNGYQPNNINGTKLVNSGMSTGITGKEQTIWKANGKYWIWRGDLNKYVEVDIGGSAVASGMGASGSTVTSGVTGRTTIHQKE